MDTIERSVFFPHLTQGDPETRLSREIRKTLCDSENRTSMKKTILYFDTGRFIRLFGRARYRNRTICGTRVVSGKRSKTRGARRRRSAKVFGSKARGQIKKKTDLIECHRLAPIFVSYRILSKFVFLSLSLFL